MEVDDEQEKGFQELPETMSGSENRDDVSEASDEDELECRVCRGPVEEDRPLYSPCKCSGSIGLTHQDCLASWLAVTRGDGKCELCGTRFRFKPKYVEGAPEQLPPYEVFLGLCSRATANWLPLTVRLFLVVAVWIGVAPLSTTYLYHGWIHRPSSILKRLQWRLVPGDIVSGIVISAIIIVSFLAIMSFADFLRFNWHHQHMGGDGRGQNRGQREPEAIEEEHDYDDDWVSDDILNYMAQDIGEAEDDSGKAVGVDSAEGLSSSRHRTKRRRVRFRDGDRLPDEDNDVIERVVEREQPANVGGANGDERRRDGNAWAFEPRAFQDDRRNVPNFWVGEPHGRGDLVQDERFEPQFEPLDPVLPNIDLEDDADVEFNVPLDELLGLRGPWTILLRNLFWLLAFNTSYLGIFAFIPKCFGSSLNSLLFNTTAVSEWTKNVPLVHSDNANITTLTSIVFSINSESERRATTIQLSDVTLLIVGYFLIGMFVLSMQAGVQIYTLLRVWRRQQSNGGVRRRRRDDHFPAFRGENVDAPRPLHRPENDNADNGTFGEYLSLGLDCLKALVKVAFLLFFKMLLLPLILGTWLDVATLPLLGGTAQDRIVYAGGDLFSSALLHWVAGITFMLLVTVSVLQLREVVHPDILAPLIRPQEPQPDLLGNLLHGSVAAHTRRMLVSFIIYAILLTVHIWLPVQMLTRYELSRLLPVSELKCWYLLMPQLQTPLELLLFHLAMLAILEKYKNQIGAMQHAMLVFISRVLCLQDQLIPCSIDKFVLVGIRPVFMQTADCDSRNAKLLVDPFWYELTAKPGDAENVIASNLVTVPVSSSTVDFDGEKHANGEVRLGKDKFIRLPKPRRRRPPIDSRLEDQESKYHLSTSIGRYRLRLNKSADNALTVEFWQEVPGLPVPRPPEGWDDLGGGGADIQGRWAWGREKKSSIERGVARRKPFFDQSSGLSGAAFVMKMLILLLSSWLACTLVVFIGISIPLAMGRGLLSLLLVPKHYTHDPFAFAVGSIAFALSINVLLALLKSRAISLQGMKRWLSMFRFPPIRKVGVFAFAVGLSIVVAPVSLGVLHELLCVATDDAFSHRLLPETKSSVMMSWSTGALLLYTWAFLCAKRVFTRDYWRELVEDDVAANVPDRPGRDTGHIWQGEHGRIMEFVRAMRRTVCWCEWDRVDHEILLTNCAVPITTTILKTLVTPWLLVMAHIGFSSTDLTVPYVSPMLLFRLYAVCSMLLQLASANRDAIRKWFKAAHKVARDGRYLEGEVLMNFVDSRNSDDQPIDSR